MWAAGMAWLVSAAPAERRGELIGSALAAAIVGVLLGPVLGGAATVVGHELVFSAVAWSPPPWRCGRGRPRAWRPSPARACPRLARALSRRDVLAGFWLFSLPACSPA